jgi:Chlorophyll A-B binding protein
MSLVVMILFWMFWGHLFPGHGRKETVRLASIMSLTCGFNGTGCIVPELLPSTGNVPWFEAGAAIFGPKGIQYLGIPGLINAKNIVATLIVQVLLMSYVEGYRVNGGPAGKGLDKLYPGEGFDPLGLADDPDTFAELKVKEIKNGRLVSQNSPPPLWRPCFTSLHFPC